MPNIRKRARNSADYWKDRKAQDEHVFGEVEKIVRREKSACKDLDEIYKRALYEIDKELEALKKDVGEEAITRAIMQKPLTPKELSEWGRRQEERLNQLISKYGDKEGRKIFGIENAKSAKQDRSNRIVRRNTALRESIESISSGAAADSESEIDKRLHEEALIGAKIGAEQFSKAFDGQLRVDFNTASEREIERIKKTVWNGADYSERVWANRDEMVKDLEKTIDLGVTNGWSVDRMRKELERHVASGEKSAERIVRTEMNRVSNSSELSFYKDNGVKYYQFMATEDARVCEICGGMNEKVFSVDDAAAGLNFPPMHPNCRCRTVVSTNDPEGNEDLSWLDELSSEADEMLAGLNDDDDSEVKDIADIAPTVEKWTKKDAIERINDLREYATPETMGDEVVHVWTKDGKYYRMAEDGFDDFKIKDIAAAVGDNGETFQVFKSRDLSKEIEQEIIELTQPEQGDHDSDNENANELSEVYIKRSDKYLKSAQIKSKSRDEINIIDPSNWDEDMKSGTEFAKELAEEGDPIGELMLDLLNVPKGEETPHPVLALRVAEKMHELGIKDKSSIHFVGANNEQLYDSDAITYPDGEIYFRKDAMPHTVPHEFAHRAHFNANPDATSWKEVTKDPINRAAREDRKSVFKGKTSADFQENGAFDKIVMKSLQPQNTPKKVNLLSDSDYVLLQAFREINASIIGPTWYCHKRDENCRLDCKKCKKNIKISRSNIPHEHSEREYGGNNSEAVAYLAQIIESGNSKAIELAKHLYHDIFNEVEALITKGHRNESTQNH